MNNTGNVSLTDINLTDAKCAASPVYSSGDTDGDTSILAVGELQVYTCTSIAVTQAEIDAGEVYNEVSVIVTPPSGIPTPPVDDNLTTPVLPSALIPSFTVEKATTSVPVAAGDTLTYTFDVNNTGNVSLTDINLTDAKCAASPVYSSGDTDGDTSILAVGELQVYTCTSIAVTQAEIDAGEVYNEVSVIVTPPSGIPTPPVDDNLTTPVLPSALIPSFTVEKATTSVPVAAGDTLTYTFDVNNTGNVSLTDINLTDAKCAASPVYSSGDTDGDTSILAVGELQVYTCTSIAVTQAEIDAGEVYNEVSVIVTPPSGIPTPPVDDNLTTPVLPSALIPRITLEKAGTFTDENNDGYADVGETISYEFNVTNIGNITLYDLNILPMRMQ